MTDLFDWRTIPETAIDDSPLSRLRSLTALTGSHPSADSSCLATERVANAASTLTLTASFGSRFSAEFRESFRDWAKRLHKALSKKERKELEKALSKAKLDKDLVRVGQSIVSVVVLQVDSAQYRQELESLVKTLKHPLLIPSDDD